MGSGINKRAREVITPALGRIEILEGQVVTLLSNQQNLMEGISRSLALVQDHMEVFDHLCNAFSEILGTEKVQEIVKKQIHEKTTKRADAEKAVIAEGVESGSLKAQDIVNLNSVIVGREILKNGDVRHPGWQQLLVSQAREEIRNNLIGKVVGDKLDVPAGQFEILEIYEIIVRETPVAVGKSEDGADLATSGLAEASPDVVEISEDAADKALAEYMAGDATQPV